MGEYALILIAERDQRIREFQQYFLEKEGLSVEFADDGEAALSVARERQPSLVITEILMPKLDGLALCRQLQLDPVTSHIPVIIFSLLAAAARASEAGAIAFLRKPLVESVFVGAVRAALVQPPATQLESR
jgi:CheY-like chemotaxis protein